MFKKISRSLALQFTGFVFLLFLVNGVLFLAADFSNARHDTSFRLARNAQLIVDHAHNNLLDIGPTLPPSFNERVRVTDASGTAIYTGGVFEDVPFTKHEGLSNLTVQNDDYTVLTSAILGGGQVTGYIQLAEVDRQRLGDLPLRALLYLLVSIAISGLTYFVGWYFAKRSLNPAEEMFARLNQFTQDASHELRTPLAVLGSSLDVALKTKQYREGIMSAKDDLKEIASLVDRLLELARLDVFALEMNAVNLSDLASSTVKKFQPLAAERSVAIETAIAPDIHVQGDASLLRQVIQNFISNAIKFNKADGTVHVALNAHALSVSDTGIGIASGDLPRVFERFYQSDTSRSKEGFGLGLSLVKRIVDLHGWTVTVQSQEKKGTTFTVHFSSTGSHKAS